MEKHIALTQAEEKLAEIIWRHAPLSSPALVTLAEQQLRWKKSTTYTILKKLCNKGVFCNENATVSVKQTREALLAQQSRSYVEDSFGGSLPKFIAAFIGGKKLTQAQAEELRQLIDAYEGGDGDG